MRKIPAALAVLGLTTLALAGCSTPSASGACPRPTAGPEVIDLITVKGALDAEPRVTAYTPLKASGLAFGDVVTGDGLAIATPDQLAVLDIAIFSGETGESIIATPYDGDMSRVFPVAQWFQNFPGLEDALQCATEGSRVAVAMGPGAITDEAVAGLGLAEGDTAIAVVDVRKVYLPAADGANQFNSGLGLPAVVRAPDGRPGLVMPAGAAPDDIVIQTLKKGSGAVVTGDQPVRLHYTGVVWGEDEPFDSSWDSGAVSFELGQVVPGFAQAVEGQTVGSQVLVVIPPELGYGDADQGRIPANSTLVFVIDILGLDAPAAE